MKSVAGRQKFCMWFEDTIIEELRNAAWYTRETLTDIINHVLESNMQKLRDEFNKGKKFPQRKGPLLHDPRKK